MCTVLRVDPKRRLTLWSQRSRSQQRACDNSLCRLLPHSNRGTFLPVSTALGVIMFWDDSKRHFVGRNIKCLHVFSLVIRKTEKVPKCICKFFMFGPSLFYSRSQKVIMSVPLFLGLRVETGTILSLKREDVCQHVAGSAFEHSREEWMCRWV